MLTKIVRIAALALLSAGCAPRVVTVVVTATSGAPTPQSAPPVITVVATAIPASPTAQSLAPVSTPQAHLSCSDAGSLVGQTVTCRMQRPYCSYRPDVNGAPTFCNDAPYPGHTFTLLVWGEDWSRYDGVCIDVTGLVVRYKGKPEIVADDPSQVSPCR
jgi:hypothetical protein